MVTDTRELGCSSHFGPRVSSELLRDPQSLLAFAGAACILSEDQAGTGAMAQQLRALYCSFRKPMVGSSQVPVPQFQEISSGLFRHCMQGHIQVTWRIGKCRLTREKKRWANILTFTESYHRERDGAVMSCPVWYLPSPGSDHPMQRRKVMGPT